MISANDSLEELPPQIRRVSAERVVASGRARRCCHLRPQSVAIEVAESGPLFRSHLPVQLTHLLLLRYLFLSW